MSLARVLASLVTLSLSVAVLGGTAGPAAGVDEQPFVFEGQQQGAWPNPCRDIPGYFEESRTETPTPGGEGLVDIIVVCQPAPPGYFTAVGSRFRLPCPVSRFQPDAGQTYCLLAPVGFYVDRRGASEAMKCPPGTTTESTASASVDDCVVVDTTPPVVTAATDRDPNPAGWFRAPVTVTWTAEDEVDGLLPAPPPVIVDSEGGNQSATSEVACDAAGNCAAGVLDGISLDRTAPELSGATVGSANHAGWFDAPVTVSWTCSDALSGVEECSEPVEIGEGADQSVTGIAVDVAGNSTEMTMDGIHVDTTPPSVALASPAQEAQFGLNAAVAADYTCADALHPEPSCLGTAARDAAIDSSSVGEKQFTVTATDAAGNTTIVTHDYRVAYAFSGFEPPVAPDVTTVARAGRTVPLKFRVTDDQGAPVTDLRDVSLSARSLTCDLATTEDQLQEHAPGSTALRHLGGGHYRYKWKTPEAYGKSCKTLLLDLGDGVPRTADFRFAR